MRLWDTATGQEVLNLSGHAAAVHTVAYSPDGRRLASSSVDGTARLWDAISGQALQTLSGHAGIVHFVTFSPDGRRLASCGTEGTVKLWDIGSEQEALTLRGHAGSVASVAFSPDGRRLASAGLDKTIRLWDAETGQEARVFRGHTSTIYDLAFSPDGRRLASAGLDASVRLWNPDSGQEVQVLRGHTGAILGLAFSPDGRRLASAGLDKTVRLWDAESGQEVQVLRGHTDLVYDLAFSPDGRRLASTSADETVRLWDADTGNEVRTFARAHGHGRWCGVQPRRPPPRLGRQDRRDGEALGRRQRGTRSAPCTGTRPRSSVWRLAPTVAVSPPPGAGSVRLWDPDTGQPVLSLSGQAGTGRGVAFSPDGRRLATAAGPTVKIWDATPLTPELRKIREAVDLVEFLFGQHLPTSEVLDRIRDNPTLDPEVRRQALDLAGSYGDRLLDQEAERVVNALYETLLRPAVRARLLRRQDAQRAGAAAGPDPGRADPGVCDPPQYGQLAGRIPAGRRTGGVSPGLGAGRDRLPAEPGNGAILNTLGVAQYRAELYREAVATLTQSDRLNSEGGGYATGRPGLPALAHHRLGESDQARTVLGRLRALMKKPEHASTSERVYQGRLLWSQMDLMKKPEHASASEAQSFLREAEAIELDLAFPSDPFAPLSGRAKGWRS